MANTIEDLHIRPLFYDALSGEFYPQTDKRGGKHTLGRLAVAAFTKGSYRPSRETNPSYSIFSYRPSWAPSVKAEVDGDPEPNVSTILVRGLTLFHASVGRLDISDCGMNGPANVYIERPGAYWRIPLELGKEIDIARDLVTQVAQTYFEEVSQAEAGQ